MTITIKDFMECIDYQISDGAEYEWNSFGPNARHLDYWNGVSGPGCVSVSIVFDTQNQTVYQMEAWDETNNRQYRWIHPDYMKKFKKECRKRNIDFKSSIDGESFIDLELEEDILEKASAIVRGEEYDERVVVGMNFAEDDLFLMMKMAHEKDMSLNEYINHILRCEVDRLSVRE